MIYIDMKQKHLHSPLVKLLAIRLGHQETMAKSLVIPLVGEGQGKKSDTGQRQDIAQQPDT
jgi:hypothetical protein